MKVAPRSILILASVTILGMIAGYLWMEQSVERAANGAGAFEALLLPRLVYAGPNKTENDVIEAYRRGSKNAQSRIEMLNAFADWMASDPVACVNTMSASLVDYRYRGLLGDPETTLISANKIQDIKIRNKVITDTFRDLVAQNPMKGLDFVQVLPSGFIWIVGRDLGKALGDNAGPEMMKSVLQHPNCTQNVFTEAMKYWAKEHTDEALRFLDEIDPAQVPGNRINTRAIWGELRDSGDGEVRLRYIEKMPPSRDRDEYMAAAKGSVLAAAPEKWDSMFQTEDSKLQIGKIAGDAARKAVVSAPLEAMSFLTRIPNADAKKAATIKATIDLISKTRKDPVKIESWLKSSTDSIIADAILKELRVQKIALPKGY